MKFKVKVGVDFDAEINVEVSEVNSESSVVVVVDKVSSKTKEPEKNGFFKDWKVVAIMAVFVLVFSSGAHAAIADDYTIFDSIIDAVVEVASKAFGKK